MNEPTTLLQGSQQSLDLRRLKGQSPLRLHQCSQISISQPALQASLEQTPQTGGGQAEQH